MRPNMFFQNTGLWAGNLAVWADVFPALRLCLLPELFVLVNHTAHAVLQRSWVRRHWAGCSLLLWDHLWGRRLGAGQLLELLVEVRHFSCLFFVTWLKSTKGVVRHPADSFTSENTDVVKVVYRVVVPAVTSEITSDSGSKVRHLGSNLRNDLADLDHYQIRGRPWGLGKTQIWGGFPPPEGTAWQIRATAIEA